MKKQIAVVALMLIAGFGGWQSRQYEVDYYKQAVAERGGQLRELAGKLTDSQAELRSTQIELRTVNVTLGITRERLQDAESQPGIVLQKWQDIKKELERAEDQLELVEVELQDAKLELQLREEYYKQKLQERHEAGYADALEREVTLRDPTYQELKEFLAQDETNFNDYISQEYVCVDFAADLNNNAEAAGIRAAFVFLVTQVTSEGKWGHMINGFQTIDRGFLFVEPQNDRILELEVGNHYWGHSIKEIIIVY